MKGKFVKLLFVNQGRVFISKMWQYGMLEKNNSDVTQKSTLLTRL